jgi:hypothetical protein
MPASNPSSSCGEPDKHSTHAKESTTKDKKVEKLKDVQTKIKKPDSNEPEVFKTPWHEHVFSFHS